MWNSSFVSAMLAILTILAIDLIGYGLYAYWRFVFIDTRKNKNDLCCFCDSNNIQLGKNNFSS
jgi:hypothetical protein